MKRVDCPTCPVQKTQVPGRHGQAVSKQEQLSSSLSPRQARDTAAETSQSPGFPAALGPPHLRSTECNNALKEHFANSTGLLLGDTAQGRRYYLHSLICVFPFSFKVLFIEIKNVFLPQAERSRPPGNQREQLDVHELFHGVDGLLNARLFLRARARSLAAFMDKSGCVLPGE